MKKIIICLTLLFGVAPGCNALIGSKDLQRDVFGYLAIWLLNRNNDNMLQNEPGENGLACWDLDENGIANLVSEDINQDGYVDVWDCQGQDGQDGADGVDGQDGQDGVDGNDGRNGDDGLSCWDLNENGQPDCLSESCFYNEYPAKTRMAAMMQEIELVNEDTNYDGVVNVLDCVGQNGENGENGAVGPSGPLFFSVFVEDFWRHGTGEEGFEVDNVDIKEPELKNNSSVAFRVAVPQVFDLNRDAHVTLRLFILKNNGNGCPDQNSKTSLVNNSWWWNSGDDNNKDEPDCFEFDIIGKRLQDGTNIQNWGDTRNIVVNSQCLSDGLVTVDLPISVSCEDGLGWPMVFPGDFLAFELQANCINNGEYTLLGAELFSYSTYELTNSVVVCED